MTQDSTQVIVPGHGRIWLGPTDTLPPGQILQITGGPTTATFKLTVGGVSTGDIVLAATDSLQAKELAIAAALAALAPVGAGNVVIVPGGADSWTFLIVLDPKVEDPAITVVAGSTFTAGTTPGIVVSGVGFAASFAAYNEIGHTSPDSPLQINRSGGDITTLGSWQADGIDQSQAAVTLSMAYSLLQRDIPSMKLYHGSNSAVVNGQVQTQKGGGSPTETAFFLIIRNGAKAALRHVPRISTIAADGESFDVSKLAEMPVASSILSSDTLAYAQSLSQVGVAA